MKNLHGKVAFISGGAGGIGAALARELAAAGVRVAIADLDLARAETVANSGFDAGQAIALKLDVTDPASWLAARENVNRSLGPVDILCSNAGVGYTGAIESISIDGWRWVYEVNLMGSLHALQTFLPEMKVRDTDCHVLLTCSITSLWPFALQGAYTSSKAALLNLAGVLRQELSGTRVGVSALCPGIVATRLRDHAEQARPAPLRSEPDADTGPSPLVSGMSPEAVARAAVHGIRENRFYLFTHADYRAGIAAEATAIIDAMASSAQPGYSEPIMLTRRQSV